MKNLKSAFTLTEVLIAVTIVGIIAALTIPNVVTKYNKKTNVLKLKKVYHELQQNLSRATYTGNIMGNNVYAKFFAPEAGGPRNFLERTNFYKIKGECVTENARGYVCRTLQDGVELGFGLDTANKVVKVYVDVNGNEGPNNDCEDQYKFNIYNDGSIDELAPNNRNTQRTTCFGKLLDNDWNVTD